MELAYDTKTEREKEEIYAMYQEIFEDPEPFAQYYFQQVYPDNQVLMLKKEGTLAAMIHLNPYTLVWNGREWSASYIVAVSTRARFRRQGMMAALLQKTFRDLYDRGELFTYLIPANEAYYTPFDFAFVMDWYEEIAEEPDSFRGQPADESNILPFRQHVVRADSSRGQLADESGWKYRIQKIEPEQYQKAADYLNERRKAAFAVWVRAGKDYIRRQDEEMKSEAGGLCFLYRETDSQIEGFFSYTMDEDNLSVANVFLPEGCGRKEFRHILEQKFGKKEIEICFPGKTEPEEGLRLVKKPKIMVRILRLKDLLEQRRGRKWTNLTFLVKDRFLPENNGCFCWEIGPEGSHVTKGTKEPICQVDIRTLTKLLFGYQENTEKAPELPEEMLDFFANLEPMGPLSITEQV